jgi:hypothetical protein
VSDHDAYQDEVERVSLLSDRDLDLLLAGQVPSGWTGEEDLARFTRDAKRLLATPPSEAVAARHLAAITDAAAAARQGIGPQRDESPSPAAITDRYGPRRRWRRKALAVAGIFGVSVATLGGAAYAGVLPDPVQRAVADVAGRVGLSLPGAEDDLDVPRLKAPDILPASRRDVESREQRSDLPVSPVATVTPSRDQFIDQADNERAGETERVFSERNVNGGDVAGDARNRNHNVGEVGRDRDQSGDVGAEQNDADEDHGDDAVVHENEARDNGDGALDDENEAADQANAPAEDENDAAADSDHPVWDEDDSADQTNDSVEDQDDIGSGSNATVPDHDDETGDRSDDSGGNQDG